MIPVAFLITEEMHVCALELADVEELYQEKNIDSKMISTS